ncbi:hypothetical protein TSAR_004448 [Trichomalopsis sarcophagae]|uniref:Uncharacterized protein n=1 Tax=Trichomalopsis sarcophagae TaxID=543379 RepID=A0A232EXF1_9HYME|nr:hypothetical protein TSAR_004448 [Trichomalopsis sarcophagae]
MDPNVEHYYFTLASRTLSRINNGDIPQEQFVHEISHATAYLSYFAQQQIFHRILECDNIDIYYALRKIELKNLPQLINFLTEAFLCPYSFGNFAVKLDDSNRDLDEHFDNFQYITKSRVPVVFIEQLNILAIMVFVRELSSTLYQDIYDSAPKRLNDASKLADHFYYTNGPRYRPIISKHRSVSLTKRQEDVPYYYPATRFEIKCTKSDNHVCCYSPSSAKQTAARSSNSEYEYDSPANNFKNSSSYYSESSETDPDFSFTKHNSDSDVNPKFSANSESSESYVLDPTHTIESDSSETGRVRHTFYEDIKEQERPVARIYSLRNPTSVNSNIPRIKANNVTRSTIYKDEIMELNSKINNPQVSGFRDMSEHKRTTTARGTSSACPPLLNHHKDTFDNIENEFYQKPSYFRKVLKFPQTSRSFYQLKCIRVHPLSKIFQISNPV